jgi:hypothetical protein
MVLIHAISNKYCCTGQAHSKNCIGIFLLPGLEPGWQVADLVRPRLATWVACFLIKGSFVFSILSYGTLSFGVGFLLGSILAACKISIAALAAPAWVLLSQVGQLSLKFKGILLVILRQPKLASVEAVQFQYKLSLIR